MNTTEQSGAKTDRSRSMDSLGLTPCVKRNTDFDQPSQARSFVETEAVSRQLGSHRLIQLGSVNFWSGKSRCAESRNYLSRAWCWCCTIGNYIKRPKGNDNVR